MDSSIESQVVYEMNPEGEKTPQQWAQHWQKEIAAAGKRLRDFQSKGNKVVDRYLDERRSDGGPQSRLNLFYTNVSTLQSMLFGSTPRVDVSRAHQDPDDDVARVASNLFQRLLEADSEPSGEDLPSVLKAALQDRLLPGLGMARVRYTYESEVEVVIDPMTGMEMEMENITNERVPIDYVHWQDLLWGWCRTWDEMPWLAFRNYMTKSEIAERFGEDYAGKLEYKNQTPTGENDSEADQESSIQKAAVWEIWCKKSKSVYWWSKGCDTVLDSTPDPLQLTGFWPSPRPMAANLTTNLFRPEADFILAQDLYNEVDELQTRIAIITEAVKVVGVYDATAGASVGRMLQEGVDNDMIPVDNWAMFSEKGGVRGAVDWFPVDTVVGVLQTLQGVQQAKVSQLYEVTGLSDIMRGAQTDQYTAASTQATKVKMGSIRVQALQEEFARFASEIEQLKAEVIGKHYTPQSIVTQSAAMYMPQVDVQYVEPAIQLMKSPDCKWRIEIRPESIAMQDYAQVKQERTEFLMAMAQFVQSAQAAVKVMPEALPILIGMIKFTMSGFKGAAYLEGMMDQALDSIQQSQGQQKGQPQQPSPEQMKAQMEQQKMQMEMQKAQMELQKMQMKAQADMALQQSKLQGEMAKIQADSQADMTKEQVASQNNLAAIAAQLSARLQESQAQLAADLEIERAQAEYDVASQQIEHQNNMTEAALNAQISAGSR
jgi:hypothetical protein